MQPDYDLYAYFKYYWRHIHYVVLAYNYIEPTILANDLLNSDEYEYLHRLISNHDLSKVSKEELVFYARYFFPIGEHDINKDKKEFKIAVAHHKKNNLHHYESLKNYNGSYWKCYIIELICDYIAMGWQFDNYLFDYYNANKENIDLPKNYKDFLEYVLTLLDTPSKKYIKEPMTFSRECELELYLSD